MRVLWFIWQPCIEYNLIFLILKLHQGKEKKGEKENFISLQGTAFYHRLLAMGRFEVPLDQRNYIPTQSQATLGCVTKSPPVKSQVFATATEEHLLCTQSAGGGFPTQPTCQRAFLCQGTQRVSSWGPLGEECLPKDHLLQSQQIHGSVAEANTFKLTRVEDFVNCNLWCFWTFSGISALLQDFSSFWKLQYLSFIIWGIVKRWNTCFRRESESFVSGRLDKYLGGTLWKWSIFEWKYVLSVWTWWHDDV